MIRHLTGFIRSLPSRPGLLALLALVGAGLVGLGGYYSYRAYDFVEHDNDFCLSCHLMEDAFDKFARSEHRGLGCKACHQPSLAGRSQMALTQIIEQPEELSAHAEVPNERCASCHIDGDPEKWELIVSSAGHRVHMESEDPILQGLNCVECHSTSVHQFTSTDQTCGQAGCHENTEIRLGRMGDFTIHCAACHGFNTPVATEAGMATPAEALRPGEDTCLSCHQMRVLIELPEDDPHDRACASCHNPHQQETPAQAVETCATAGCHTDVADLTPMHAGLERGVVETCTTCHEAHDFRLDGNECTSCHADVHDRPATGPARTVAPANAPFLHADHRADDCASCHVSEESHGRVSVTSLSDCRSCHHEAPVANDCTACHRATDFPEAPYQRLHVMAFDVTEPVARRLPFDHARHEATACATCHREPLTRSAAAASCSSCHTEHHQPESDCMSCHVEAPPEAHPAEVHVGCSGTGCHEESSFDQVPRTRAFCLACHQEFTDHKADAKEGCADCHTLPPPRAGRRAG